MRDWFEEHFIENYNFPAAVVCSIAFAAFVILVLGGGWKWLLF